MKILKISRSTLYNYTKDGTIKATLLDNGYYDYDEDSVFKIMKKDSRVNVIYARVSTYKQKNDLEKQINTIKNFCLSNDITIDNVYSDVSSGLDLDRKELSQLIDRVMNNDIKHIYVSHRDRLTRLSFRTLEELFNKYKKKIIIINNDPHLSNDSEVFEELISLMHIFSTTLYSNRRKNKIKIYKADIENFISET